METKEWGCEVESSDPRVREVVAWLQEWLQEQKEQSETGAEQEASDEPEDEGVTYLGRKILRYLCRMVDAGNCEEVALGILELKHGVNEELSRLHAGGFCDYHGGRGWYITRAGRSALCAYEFGADQEARLPDGKTIKEACDAQRLDDATKDLRAAAAEAADKAVADMLKPFVRDELEDDDAFWIRQKALEMAVAIRPEATIGALMEVAHTFEKFLRGGSGEAT